MEVLHRQRELDVTLLREIEGRLEMRIVDSRLTQVSLYEDAQPKMVKLATSNTFRIAQEVYC